MSSVYKRHGRNRWSYKLRVNGQWKTFPGFTDKTATREKAAQHERLLARGEIGLVNDYEPHNQRPLAQHIAEYLLELASTGRDAMNNGIVKLRLHKTAEACGWSRLPDITAASFMRFRDTGDVLKSAPKTRNDYAQIVRQFCRWCVRNGRMPIDPLNNLAAVKTNGDIRRQRRALTDAEVSRLLGVSPEPRRTVYLMALLTGLRRGELRQLRQSDVHLDAAKPFLTARASTTKNSREAVIFLRDDAVTALRTLNPSCDAEALLLRVPKRVTFYKDLAAAGIERRDRQGRVTDFHCLRHTLCTNLNRAGVSMRTAMEVMRHSDIRLTSKTYTDAALLPTAEAVEALPRWDKKNVQTEIKTGTYDIADTVVQNGTTGGTKKDSFRGILVHAGSLAQENGDTHQTRMGSEETHDYQGVCEPPENMRPLGIEPRTHRLKVCCSTS